MADPVLPPAAGETPRAATPEQLRASDPTVCAWVAASAGSGKTQVLGDRVLRLLLTGAKPTGILCLTFTRAAAAEMANRIANRLRDWAVSDDAALIRNLAALTGAPPNRETIRRARSLFAKVLDAPGGMRIETIHAFCQSLLRRFPLEAEVAPHFRLIEDREQALLEFEAREAMLVAARSGRSRPVAAALARVVSRMSEGRLVELLGEFLGARDRLATLERRMGSAEALRRAMAGRLGIPADATAESILAEACADHAFDADLLRRAGQALLQGTRSDQDRGAVLLEWLGHVPDLRAVHFDVCKAVYLTAEGVLRERLATKGAVSAFPDVVAVLEAEARRIHAVLERIRAADCLADSHALTVLALDIEQRYRRLKVAHAALDYDDLILKARDLLRKSGIAPWVLYKLDGGIDHILVDEAQDTNHLQWDLIKALTEEFFAGQGAAEDRHDDREERYPRTVFAVGDRKQSIFSFQGAEPEAAQKVRDFYADLLPSGYTPRDSRPPFVDVPLDTSFRSTGAVLKLVDAVINGPARDGVLDPGKSLTHGVHRRGQAGLVELWPRCQPVGVAEPDPWAPPRVTPGPPAPHERLAQALAAKIADMVGRDRLESKDRLVRAGDILVLVRSRDPFVLSLVRALKGKGIAVSGIDRLRLLEDIAVMDLMAFADFLLMPEDDLNLAALLKSPLFDISEADVLRLCADRGNASVWSRLKALAPETLFFREAADLLGRYLGRADFNAPFALFADLLSAGGGRKRIHARLGAEADEAIDEFLNLALAYAQTDTPSLQGFLHWIRSTAAIVKRELGNADVDQVRIMTVHGAKGLQAPIVFLADKPNFDNRSSGLFWIEGAGTELPLWSPRKAADVPLTRDAREEARRKRQEETNRLLYVALTRAEDRLAVCGRLSVKTAPPGWHEQVAQAFATLPGALQSKLADWVPPNGVVIDEGWTGDHFHYAEPQTAEPERAQERPSLAVEDTKPPEWARTRVAAEPDPPRPLIPSRPSGPEPAVISPIAADQGYRFKRGLLVHRLLELLPGVPPADRAAAAERYLRRPVHGLAAAEAGEIRDEVLRILADPALAPLFGPGSLAEVPVVATLRGPDGRTEVLTGQIDRLLVREQDCIILDYKSNRPAPMQASQVASAYLRQLAAYKAAIAAVYPGKSIACKILWTAGPSLMPIPESLLSGFAPSA
ncbi:MAG TPA: double-strand break repair helicase AddA [Dongiaceae bacterium]|jgi:ATP-dependent helicase/nuclease subunit A|nr:double-strand break repair helicase AddA [Dongiaceae bacterium]